jgi:ethanolamine ammonia-lyase small subunit
MAAPPDPWRRLAALTPARIGLGRAGPGLPTREVLAFALAHAKARDAVHAPLDAEAVAGQIAGLGLAAVQADSRAPDRETYLRRPDLGRALSPAAGARLVRGDGIDLALVVADGLSSAAVHAHAAAVIAALLPHAERAGWRLGPVVVARQARVALGDEIGAALAARAVAVLIGERPGLSAPDSLGIYLTHGPRPGRTDAERNCISNIHGRGLSPQAAAARLAWLTAEALRRGLTGVGLKDESDLALAHSETAALS